MCNPRLTAACMLQEIISAKIFLSEAKGRLESAGEQDNAFVNMLLLTALRHLVYIRKIIKQYVRKKLPAQSAFAQYALILGITEALYLDTPDYALINSYVDIVKKQLDKYVAGFVNAVLRKVCSARNELQAADCGEFFPQEFYKILRSGYGNKTIRKIENAALQEPCLDLTAAKNPRRLADELNGTLLPCETIRLPNVSTVADGIAVKQPGELTYDLCHKHLDGIVTVTEDEICAAILAIIEQQKMVVEGAGAVAVAAAMFNKVPIAGKKTICILSGGNVDVTILNRVIHRGLVKSGRICKLTLTLEDKPGQLVGVSQIISSMGGNVVKVNHERSDDSNRVTDCILQLQVETRNHEHVDSIRKALIEAGFNTQCQVY